MTFEELGLSAPLLKAISDLGYVNPMPVQEKVIPELLQGETDLVALAETGSGKTAAYGLPLLQLTDAEMPAVQALILSPTRELCLQITQDLTDYSAEMPGVRVLAVYGGSSIETQIKALSRNNIQIVVATPGRLLDLLRRGAVSLDRVIRVVLDEADEMLSMGFSEDLNDILSHVPEGVRKLMFSATMSQEISKIAQNYLRGHKEIVIGKRNEGAQNVEHVAYVVQAKDKYLALKRVVDYYPRIYGIVFCRTRLETQEVADHLINDGYNADALHGELSQQQRDLTMQKFRQHNTQLLVATDVAARGIDVDDLTHVINYGLPDDIEVYTHRSGRTGRAGKKGQSIAIVNLKEQYRLKHIEKIIGKTFQRATLPTGDMICEKQLYKVIDDLERVEVNEEHIGKFMDRVVKRLEWLSKEDLIARLLSREYGRFAEYYANAPEIVVPTEEKKEKGTRGGAGKGPRKAEAGYTRMFIAAGRMDGIVPAKIIDLINRHVKGRVEVGRIDLMQKFSFFEVKSEHAQTVLNALSNVKVNGRMVSAEVAETGDGAAAESKGSRGGRKAAASSAEGGRGRKKAAPEEGSRSRGGRKAQAEEGGFRKTERAKRAEEEKAKLKKNRKAAQPEEPKKKKPSREERGYTAPRGRKATKEDWMKFFTPEYKEWKLKGEEPDFSEEGWAKQTKKKK